ncbi:MAG: hypothetical protein ACC642_08565, partial [Pseudomonadales bacterium]
PRGAPGHPAGSRPPQSSATLTALTRRLLVYILRRPWTLLKVSEALRAEVLAHAESDIFAEIVSYLIEHPEAELSEVVGRWAGQPVAGELSRLAAQSVTLSDEAIISELQDGLGGYVALKAREQRAKLVTEIKAAPSTEKLQALRSLQQGAGPPGTPAGTPTESSKS